MVNGNIDKILRSISWWFHFDPYPFDLGLPQPSGFQGPAGRRTTRRAGHGWRGPRRRRRRSRPGCLPHPPAESNLATELVGHPKVMRVIVKKSKPGFNMGYPEPCKELRRRISAAIYAWDCPNLHLPESVLIVPHAMCTLSNRRHLWERSGCLEDHLPLGTPRQVPCQWE